MPLVDFQSLQSFPCSGIIFLSLYFAGPSGALCLRFVLPVGCCALFNVSSPSPQAPAFFFSLSDFFHLDPSTVVIPLHSLRSSFHSSFVSGLISSHIAWLPPPCSRAESAGPPTSTSWPRLRILLICSLMARTSAGPASRVWAIQSKYYGFCALHFSRGNTYVALNCHGWYDILKLLEHRLTFRAT